MGAIMKIGAKDPNGKVKALNSDVNGMLNTHHVWEGASVTVLELNVRDTEAHVSDVFDISAYSLISLRVSNTTDQPVIIGFYGDVNPASYLADIEGDIKLEIVNKSREQIITPNDLPCLPYLNSIKVRAKYDTAPTSGTLTIKIACKR